MITKLEKKSWFYGTCFQSQLCRQKAYPRNDRDLFFLLYTPRYTPNISFSQFQLITITQVPQYNNPCDNSSPGKLFGRVLAVVDLGAALEQELDEVVVAVLGGEVKGRVAALVGRVDVGTPDQQELGCVGVALPDGVVQGPQALGHRLVRLGPAGQQDPDLVEGLHPDYRVRQLALQRIRYALGRHLWGAVRDSFYLFLFNYF